MKMSKFTIFFFPLLLTLGSLSTTYAQEYGSPSFESYDNDPNSSLERVTSPRESTESAKSTVKTTAHPVLQLDNTDSVVMRFQNPSPRPAQKTTTKSKDDDDSILSFNFLYYLIERYKLQDIIE